MDSNERHSIIRTDLLISVLTLIFIYLSYVGSQQSSDPCERPITCEENGTRTANVENCSSYFECSHIDGGVIPISLWWVLRRCAQNERYDHLRQTCVNVSDHHTQPCYNNCSANRVDMILSQHSVYDHLFEGSMVQFVCCFRYLFFESQVHVQSLQWSVDGRRISNYGKRITIIIVSDDSDNLFCSTLTFDPIRQRDSGCIQCTAMFNANGSHVIMKELYTFVHPWKRPSVSVYPLTQHVFDSEQFVLHCSLPPGYRGNFTWFEEGHVINPSCGGVNISQPTRGSSVLQKSIRWQRGSMTFSCMAKTAFIDTDPTYATVFVMNSNDKFCDWDFDDENSIKWSRTKVGHEDKQRCPGNSTGVCFRECLWIESFAVWSQPDCHECVTQGFQNILNQLNDEDELNNQTVVAEIARDLFDMTKSVGLSLGNLNASLQAIDMLGDLRTDSSPNHDEIISVIRTISNVLQPSNSYAWERLRAMNDTVATILLSSAEVYGRSLAMMNDTNWTTVEADYMILEAVSLDISNLTQTVTFPSGSSWKWNEDRLDTISISAEALDSASTDSGQRLRLWSAYYRNIDAQLQNGASIGINSRVLSLTIDGLQTSEELKQPVIVTLQHNRQDNIENLPRTCVFWKFSDTDGGEWDSTGCSLVSTTSTHTVCSCNHLTNFAILMSLNPSDDVVLSIISTVGCGISVAALILTVIVYAVNWKQMKSDQAAVLLNLCLALIIANIIFLVGADKVVPEDGCKAVAVLLHYFFLAAFFLMLAEGIELLLYIIFVFHVRRKIETASIIATAWGCPLIIVVISIAVKGMKGYISEYNVCWLSIENGLIWAFAGPAFCIILVNFLILAIIMRRISRARFGATEFEKKRRLRATLWNISVICPVLGVTWAFGILSFSFDHEIFQYLFVVANSLQGMLIFLYHAVLRNKKISEGCCKPKKPKPVSVTHTNPQPTEKEEKKEEKKEEDKEEKTEEKKEEKKEEVTEEKIECVAKLVNFFMSLEKSGGFDASRSFMTTLSLSTEEQSLMNNSEVSVTAAVHSSSDDAPGTSDPDGVAPGGVAPGGVALDGVASDGADSCGIAPGGVVSGEFALGDVAPGGVSQGGITTVEIASGSVGPGMVSPDKAVVTEIPTVQEN